MADKTWKAVERRICKALGGQRTPLSGGSSRHTRADCIGIPEYVEIKHRARIPFFKTWWTTAVSAEKEQKEPVLIIHKKGLELTLVMITLEYYKRLRK